MRSHLTMTLAAAAVLTLAACDGTSGSSASQNADSAVNQSKAGAQTPALAVNVPGGGPDVATVKAALEGAWTDLGSSDTQSFDYHAIDYAPSHEITPVEGVADGIPAGATGYPVAITVTRHFDEQTWDLVRHFVFYRGDNGEWRSSVVPNEQNTSVQRT